MFFQYSVALLPPSDTNCKYFYRNHCPGQNQGNDKKKRKCRLRVLQQMNVMFTASDFMIL